MIGMTVSIQWRGDLLNRKVRARVERAVAECMRQTKRLAMTRISQDATIKRLTGGRNAQLAARVRDQVMRRGDQVAGRVSV